jgi:uncharacterized protein
MKNKNNWALIIIAIVLMLAGSLLAAWINTGAGAATVKELSIHGSNGYTISAYLYTPKTASTDSPAPGILMYHGLNNQKDYMDQTALEFARRGYVVLSADMTGHGDSNGANGENDYGGIDTLNYLLTLPIVDKSNIGLVGMSQGGFGPVTRAANAMPDSYKSIFYMESECTAPGSMDISVCTNLKNVAFNIGSITELPGMIMVAKGTDAVTSPVVQPVFNTPDPIIPNQLYGSIEEGTARILYQPFEDHAGSTDSPVAIGNAITWMQMTLKGGQDIPPSNQIWGWKLFGTTLALAGAFLFLFPMGSVLLQSAYFSTLKDEVPEYKGFKGLGWWIAAAITTAVGPLLYIWTWNHGFFSPLIPISRIFPQSYTNIYLLWSIVVGSIATILILFNHYGFTKKTGASAYNYGLTWKNQNIDWAKVGKSVLLAVCVLLPVYLILSYVKGVLYVDFRAWVVALMPMSWPRFLTFLAYLIPFAIFYIPEAIIFAGFIRVDEGKASLAKEMVINSIILTLGAAVWLLLLYVPIMNGGTQILASGPMGSTIAGMSAIYYIPLIVLWPLVACLYTYFFRKTGRVYTGIAMATIFMVWYLAAFGAFAFPI